MRKGLSVLISICLVMMLIVGLLPISAMEFNPDSYPAPGHVPTPTTLVCVSVNGNVIQDGVEVIYTLKDKDPFAGEVKLMGFGEYQSFWSLYCGVISAADIEGITIDGVGYSFTAEDACLYGHSYIDVALGVPLTSYMVKYVDADDKQLAEDKIVEGVESGETITEKPVVVENYTPDAESKDLKLDVDPENNVIKFVYTPVPTSYTVKYVDSDGNKLADDKVVLNAEWGTTVTEKPIEIANYKADKDSKDLQLDPDSEKNVITFVYNAVPTSYVVKYLNKADNSVLATEKLVTGQKIGATITENALDIANYKADSSSKSLTLAVKDNEIIFYYTAVTTIQEEAIPSTGAPADSIGMLAVSLLGLGAAIIRKKH